MEERLLDLICKGNLIANAIPYYRNDSLLRKNLDSYYDRGDGRTNRISSYKRVVNLIRKHLNNNFYYRT